MANKVVPELIDLEIEPLCYSTYIKMLPLLKESQTAFKMFTVNHLAFLRKIHRKRTFIMKLMHFLRGHFLKIKAIQKMID